MVTILDNRDENRYRLANDKNNSRLHARSRRSRSRGLRRRQLRDRRRSARSSQPRTSTATSCSQIGGSHVDVTSILSDPNADPHLFEPGTSNGLAVAKARLVIQNGVGYDAFMTQLEHASPSRSARRDHHRRRARRPRSRRQSAPLVRRPEAPGDRRRDRRGARAPGSRACRRVPRGLARFDREPCPAATRSRCDQGVASPAARSPTPSRCPATCSPRPACGTSRPSASPARSRTAPSRRPRRSRR